MSIKEKDIVKTKSYESVGNPVDSYVGSRIKLRRAILGYSQEKLSEELGITFQQVQKYERGLNRVSASRLWNLSRVLGVSPNYFFEDMDENFQSTIPNQISAPMGFSEEAPSLEDDVLIRKDVLELVRHYVRITDPRIAKNILDLVKSITPNVDFPLDDDE